MNIRAKLIGGFLASAAVTLVAGAISFTAFHRLEENARLVDGVYLPATRHVLMADMMHDGLMGVVYRAIFVAEKNDPREASAVREELAAYGKNFTRALNDLDALALPAEERRALAAVRPTLDAYIASGHLIAETAFTNRAAAIGALPDFQQSFEALESTMGKLGDRIEAGAGAAVEAGHGISRTGNLVVGVAVVAGVVLAVLMGFGFSRSIFSTLGPLVNTLSSGSTETAAAAGQVSKASQSLAEGASSQAASLEETSASLEELSSMAARNTENAQRAKGLGREARESAEAGRTNVVAMGEAITSIQTSGREMVTAVDGISTASREVAKIIKTIDEIAFQTNILALNAAVEAARAGEAGLGFAVVADEVRNLAQRSATAAKETARKIEESLRKSDEGVAVTQRVNQHLSEVQAKVVGVETSLQAISEKVRQVDEVLSEVASASNEQTQGVKQINTAVGQLDRITQANAAASEESASASEELNAQAKSLETTVGALREIIGVQTPAGVRGHPATGAATRVGGPVGQPRESAPVVTTTAAVSSRSGQEPIPMPEVSSRVSKPSEEAGFRDF